MTPLVKVDDLAMTFGAFEVPVGVDPLGDFGFDGLSEQLLGALPQDVGQRVAAAGGWQRNRGIGNLSHGGVLLGKLARKQPNSTPSTPPLSTHLIHNFLS